MPLYFSNKTENPLSPQSFTSPHKIKSQVFLWTNFPFSPPGFSGNHTQSVGPPAEKRGAAAQRPRGQVKLGWLTFTSWKSFNPERLDVSDER